MPLSLRPFAEPLGLPAVLLALAGCAHDATTTPQESSPPLRQAGDHDPPASPETSSEPECTPAECQTVTPSDALIADFTDVSPDGVFVDNDSYSRPNREWWLGFYGSTYVYPEGPSGLASSTDGVWHVTGTVADWSGFGLWLGACTVDLSAYRGLSFDIWGDPGPSGIVKLFVNTGPDSPPEECRTNVGSCDENAGECVSPWTTIHVPQTANAATTVLFEEVRGGQPRATPDPAQIIQFHFAFDWYDWAGQKSDPYAVDLRVDNIRLVR